MKKKHSQKIKLSSKIKKIVGSVKLPENFDEEKEYTLT